MGRTRQTNPSQEALANRDWLWRHKHPDGVEYDRTRRAHPYAVWYGGFIWMFYRRRWDAEQACRALSRGL